MKLLWFLIVTILFTMSNSLPSGMNLFELSTRPWLFNLSLAYNRNISKLSDIPDEEFLKLKKLGMDMIWLMGVWSLGSYGLNHDRTDQGLLQHYAQVLPGYTMDDIIGSPYAITDYIVNPELGTEADLRALKAKLNSMGLLLMLDFVPNHSAVDAKWTTTNPEYYVRAPKGTSPPYDSSKYLPNGIAYGSLGYGPWTDTAQLNYWDDGERQARLTQLLYVASLADGIRCDMAYLILDDLFQQNWGYTLQTWGYSRPQQEWWSIAIQKVKQQYPNVVFLAEVYSPWQQPLLDVGFDYVYDKDVYDRLTTGNLDDLRGWITSRSISFLTHSAHFASNHDEKRAVTNFGSWWRADAAALVLYTLPGMRFFWQAQFNGYSNQLDVHLRREPSEISNESVYSFYVDRLLPIINRSAFRQGTWEYMSISSTNDSWRLLAWKWKDSSSKYLCVLNYSDQSGSGAIVLSDAAPVNGSDTIPVTDLLSGQIYYRSAKQLQTSGLFVVINSFYAQIFQY